MYSPHGCKCVFTAGGKGPGGSSPAPVTPTAPRVHLTMNHLVFHKVLGKGSFGKVGPLFPMFKSFTGFSMKWVCDTKMQDILQTLHTSDVTHNVNDEEENTSLFIHWQMISIYHIIAMKWQ